MIALASDHAGYDYKEKIKILLDELKLSYRDFGTSSKDS
ncbi:MAG: RpiB/LacA/LacB family sugar-phosphate isomerase, partial [Ignavibacteriales bacterium]|nr:RpiB/LacA/LacB family sugar-phosphate isomerase [Ignavibacteriales bacterium]